MTCFELFLVLYHRLWVDSMGTFVLQEDVDYFEQVLLCMFATDYFCDLV